MTTVANNVSAGFQHRETQIVPYKQQKARAEAATPVQEEPSTLQKVACVALKVILTIVSILTCAALSLACSAAGKAFSLPFMSSMGSALSELTKKLMKKASKSNMFQYTNNNGSDLKRYFSYFGKNLFQAILGDLSQIGQEQQTAAAATVAA